MAAVGETHARVDASQSLAGGKHLRKLGAKELITVKRAFMDIDADGSGHIDIVEVRALCSSRC